MFASSCPMLRYGGQRRFLTDEADKGVRRRERPHSTWHSGPREQRPTGNDTAPHPVSSGEALA